MVKEEFFLGGFLEGWKHDLTAGFWFSGKIILYIWNSFVFYSSFFGVFFFLSTFLVRLLFFSPHRSSSSPFLPFRRLILSSYPHLYSIWTDNSWMNRQEILWSEHAFLVMSSCLVFYCISQIAAQWPAKTNAILKSNGIKDRTSRWRIDLHAFFLVRHYYSSWIWWHNPGNQCYTLPVCECVCEPGDVTKQQLIITKMWWMMTCGLCNCLGWVHPPPFPRHSFSLF